MRVWAPALCGKDLHQSPCVLKMCFFFYRVLLGFFTRLPWQGAVYKAVAAITWRVPRDLRLIFVCRSTGQQH